jgi:hypothetical protein
MPVETSMPSVTSISRSRLLGQRVIGQPRLLGQLNPAPAGVAVSPDQHGRQQGGIHRVVHRVMHAGVRSNFGLALPLHADGVTRSPPALTF